MTGERTVMREGLFYSFRIKDHLPADHLLRSIYRFVDLTGIREPRQAEVTAKRRMIERSQDRFGLWPERLVADAAYGSAPNLAWLVNDTTQLDRRVLSKSP